jgi:hypothetical protein
VNVSSSRRGPSLSPDEKPVKAPVIAYAYGPLFRLTNTL